MEAVTCGAERVCCRAVASLGANIRAARIRAGFRQAKDFAHHMGEDAPRLSDWERDRFERLELPTLVKIAKAARCSIDDLLVGLDPDYDAAARRDLTRPSADPQSGASLLGGSPADDQTRELQRLRQELEDRRRAIAAIRDAATRIVSLAAVAGEESHPSVPAQPRGGGRRGATRR